MSDDHLPSILSSLHTGVLNAGVQDFGSKHLAKGQVLVGFESRQKHAHSLGPISASSRRLIKVVIVARAYIFLPPTIIAARASICGWVFMRPVWLWFLVQCRANPVANANGGAGGAWPLNTGNDFLPNHLANGIDYGSIHMWPDNWGRTDLPFGK